MSHTPHELAEEFPEFVEKMHELNRKVHRAETNVEPREELAEVDLRKRRAAVKDEVYAYLTK